MKRLLSIFCCAMIAAVTFAVSASPIAAAAASPRDNVLKVYTWLDYQYDDGEGASLGSDFTTHYKQLTGNNDFKIEFTYFSTVEEMLTKIESGKEDFDLACPSDYMIQQMISKDLVLPLDLDKISNYSNISPYIKSSHDTFEAAAKTSADNKNVYSATYMWGTMGALYNADKMTADQVNSLSENWSEFTSPANKGKVFIKDSMRDTYVMASIIANESKLKNATATVGSAEYNSLLTSIINDVSDENIARVKETLINMKKDVNVAFEIDDGKTDMATGKKYLNFAWSGDAIWSIMAAKQEHDANLEYVIPQIGSNVWFDGWVIPKYAKNTDAAHEFINFTLDPECAIQNMEYIGYTSGVATAEVADWVRGINEDGNSIGDGYEEDGEHIDGIGYVDGIDLSYFFDKDIVDATNFKAPKFMYPSKDDIAVCAIMRDFKDKTAAVAQMWAEMKTDTLLIVLIIVGSVLGAGLIAAIIFFVVKKVNAPKKKQKQSTAAFRKVQDPTDQAETEEKKED